MKLLSSPQMVSGYVDIDMSHFGRQNNEQVFRYSTYDVDNQYLDLCFRSRLSVFQTARRRF